MSFLARVIRQISSQKLTHVFPSSAMRFPEKLSPGTFDYFFASHQIFHCFVVLAALMHYKSALTSLNYRMTNSECLVY